MTEGGPPTEEGGGGVRRRRKSKTKHRVGPNTAEKPGFPSSFWVVLSYTFLLRVVLLCFVHSSWWWIETYFSSVSREIEVNGRGQRNFPESQDNNQQRGKRKRRHQRKKEHSSTWARRKQGKTGPTGPERAKLTTGKAQQGRGAGFIPCPFRL